MPDAADPLDLAGRLARLESRVARLEACADFDLSDDNAPSSTQTSEESIERQVAQTWFARVGILALAAGGAFVLMQPYVGVPAVLPSAIGWAVAGGLFVGAHLGRTAFTLVSRHIRGVAMALLFCATLRLSYFGDPPAVAAGSLLAHLLLPGAALLNLLIAWYRRSALLMALALLTAVATPLALGDAPSVLIGCLLLTMVVAFVGSRPEWNLLLGLGAGMLFGLYALWAMGNPIVGSPYRWVGELVSAPFLLLACVAFLAVLPMWSRVPCDTPAGGFLACANTILGYGLVLVHSYAAHSRVFTALHLLAAILLLTVAAMLWTRRQSQIATFLYAMGAYAALTVAIVHLTSVPNVFVWLSLESVIVVATAVWFRSRFIVVTNFVIYVVVVLGYVALNSSESGVSIGFGLVALVSARILNWQRHRLALKTELMRNAYLASAFVVFPYALYHLVGAHYAALAWVGLAGVYYGLNVIIRNQKYRWMAHATLVLTAGYLLVPSHEGMTMALRLVSFIALGVAFLIVSLMSTMSRR